MSSWWPFGQKKQDEHVDRLLRELFSRAAAGSPETLATYRKLTDITTVDERTSMLLEISKQIEEKEGFGWEILMAFALGDTEHKIISTAAMNLAVLQPCPDGEPLAGVRTVCHLVEKLGCDSPKSASMLSGLLLATLLAGCLGGQGSTDGGSGADHGLEDDHDLQHENLEERARPQRCRLGNQGLKTSARGRGRHQARCHFWQAPHSALHVQ